MNHETEHNKTIDDGIKNETENNKSNKMINENKNQESKDQGDAKN